MGSCDKPITVDAQVGLGGSLTRLRVYVWLKAFFPETPVGIAFWAIASAATIAVAFFDPFGLGTRTETSFQAAFDRVWESYYPTTQSKYIALITPTYDEIVNREIDYPISDGTLANAVSLARLAKARAIFLDYEFIRTPTAREIGALARAVEQAYHEKIPVFSGPIAQKPEYAELSKWVNQVDVDRSVSHAADYNLKSDRGSRSAAASLYLALCTGPSPLPRSSCDRELSDVLLGRAPYPPNMHPVALQLGSSYPERQVYYSGPTEALRCRRLSNLGVIASGLKGKDIQSPCSNYITIPFSFLADPDSRGRMIDDLRGRAVIIGAGPGLGDDHDWPGVGVLSGVMFHAAALDNLLTYGHRYRRWPDDFWGHIGFDDAIQLVAIIVTPLLVLGLVRHGLGPRARSRREHRLDKDRPSIPGSAWWALAILICAMSIPSVLAAFFAWHECWPPAPALIIFAVALPLTTTLTGDELGQRLEPFNTRLTAVALVVGLSAILVIILLPQVWAIVWLVVIFIVLTILFRPPTLIRPCVWFVRQLVTRVRYSERKSQKTIGEAA